MNKDQTFRFRLPSKMSEQLVEEKQRTGMPIAETIRRAITSYLKAQKQKNSDK